MTEQLIQRDMNYYVKDLRFSSPDPYFILSPQFERENQQYVVLRKLVRHNIWLRR